MQRPHYWKAILNIALLKDQVSPGTLHQLVMGQFQALRFENIENIDGLHAMRDDIRKRILAATVKDEGESYLIILEVVDNHEYDKSRFLKPGVLKKYLEDNMDTIKAFIKNKNYVEFGIYDLQDIELIFELEPTADSDAKTIASEPRTFLSLIFTAEQREICDNPHYPLVVEGAAGSGK